MSHQAGFAVLAISLALAGDSRARADEPSAKPAPANRLAKETSPYLLLHAHNPVDWFPWGPEALGKAKAENKPIFLSIGYSSCYWCHVMERESFMDPEIAKALNASFVCIKVDREERPDIDQIYMTALQAFRPGGWPLSMFLLPDGRPFFGGTYFPPRDRQAASGFLTIVNGVAQAWQTEKASIEKSAGTLTEIVRRRLHPADAKSQPAISRDFAAQGRARLAVQFDPEYGGFGFDPRESKRPKFPQGVDLWFLLDQARRGAPAKEPTDPWNMVRLTLDRMARGGIRDHLAGGYHRYSTDRAWLVPHFEKMLYDNALLAGVRLLAFEQMHEPRDRDEARAILEFVARRMTSEQGGFYSAIDAETKGDEGGYYVWTPDEVKKLLEGKADGALFAEVYGLTGESNFEGKRHVLNQPRPLEEIAKAHQTSVEDLQRRLGPLRADLLAARDKRPAPLRDDKIITGWNGLMIAAFADGYRVLKDENDRKMADKAADFVLDKLRTTDGRLMRTYREGVAKIPGYLEDYAFLIHGLLRLHAATKEPRRLEQARDLADLMIRDFEDNQTGGFFFTSERQENLLARAKECLDNALPGGNGVAILDLLALHRLTGESSYLERAGKALSSFSAPMSKNPEAMPVMLLALQEYLDIAPDTIIPRPLSAATSASIPKDLVRARARLGGTRDAAIAPGSEYTVIVDVTIAEGWHIYANPTGLAELRPTTLIQVPLPDSRSTLVKVTYPIGQDKILGAVGTERIALYEGNVELTARLKLATDARPGSVPVKFLLQFQTCNDKLCLPPKRLTVALDVPVAER